MTPIPRTILIYGNSIILEGISQALGGRCELAVVALKQKPDPAALAALRPDLILLDADRGSLHQLQELLVTNPAGCSPMIVGLDLDAQCLVVISSRHIPAAGLDDLVQALVSLLQPIS